MTTQISMLGPMQVDCGQGPVQVGDRPHRAVLAMLALRVGHVVSTDFIIDGVWVDPRGGAVTTVRVYVSRLRGLQHPAVAGGGLLPINRGGSGYLLEADPGTVDTAVFERRLQDGAAIVTTAPAEASALLGRRWTCAAGNRWSTSPPTLRRRAPHGSTRICSPG